MAFYVKPHLHFQWSTLHFPGGTIMFYIFFKSNSHSQKKKKSDFYVAQTQAFCCNQLLSCKSV